MTTFPYHRFGRRTPVAKVGLHIPFFYVQILQHALMLANRQVPFYSEEGDRHQEFMEILRRWGCLAWKRDRNRRATPPREDGKRQYVLTAKGRKALELAKERLIPHYKRKSS